MHLASEVKLYSLFLITTAGCLLILVSLFLWTESSWCQSSERYWSSRFLAWWQLLIGALCFIAASWTTQEMYSLSPSPVCRVSLFDRQEHCVVIHCHTNLKGKVKVDSILGFLFSLLLFWLSRIAGDSADTCGDPGTPAHASREAGNFKVRSKVRFTCAVGHTLYGSAERICFPNGTWSGRQPFCKRKGNL